MAKIRYSQAQDDTPLILLVPGTPLAPGHWMSRWAQGSEDCEIVELGLWDEPHRNTWVNKLNLAIRRADRPVVVVTDDIAALALAWWVEFEGVGPENPILGALIANVPNMDLPGSDSRLAGFGACPRQTLPFTSFLVGDLDRDLAYQRSVLRLASDWGSAPVSGDTRGDWSQGWELLQSMIGLTLSSSLSPHWTRSRHAAEPRHRAN
ncbi:RBBP9/YdeN family alpha/beta hydrolase [Novosphingobium sp. BL-52-GroH]|uniref:RBBP9/YdeN family alpha/beta hydrolase n=1 Tax=Novosphingobium sp. BL-52-GroH TaxID=3349877 RepID=UPI003850B306